MPSRFEEPVFPVPGSDQSDGCWDGAISAVSSVLPLPAQSQPDGRYRGHTGCPLHMCAAAATSQHQANEGLLALVFGSVIVIMVIV